MSYGPGVTTTWEMIEALPLADSCWMPIIRNSGPNLLDLVKGLVEQNAPGRCRYSYEMHTYVIVISFSGDKAQFCVTHSRASRDKPCVNEDWPELELAFNHFSYDLRKKVGSQYPVPFTSEATALHEAPLFNKVPPEVIGLTPVVTVWERICSEVPTVFLDADLRLRGIAESLSEKNGLFRGPDFLARVCDSKIDIWRAVKREKDIALRHYSTDVRSSQVIDETVQQGCSSIAAAFNGHSETFETILNSQKKV